MKSSRTSSTTKRVRLINSALPIALLAGAMSLFAWNGVAGAVAVFGLAGSIATFLHVRAGMRRARTGSGPPPVKFWFDAGLLLLATSAAFCLFAWLLFNAE